MLVGLNLNLTLWHPHFWCFRLQIQSFSILVPLFSPSTHHVSICFPMFPWNSQFFPSTTHYFPPSTLPRQFFGPEPGELAYCPGGWAGRDRWQTRSPGYGLTVKNHGFYPFFCQICVVILCNFGDRIVDLMFFFLNNCVSLKSWWIRCFFTKSLVDQEWFFDHSWWWICKLLFRPEMKMHIFPVKNQFYQNDQFLGRNLHQHYRLKIITSWIFTPLAGELLGKLSLMPGLIDGKRGWYLDSTIGSILPFPGQPEGKWAWLQTYDLKKHPKMAIFT